MPRKGKVTHTSTASATKSSAASASPAGVSLPTCRYPCPCDRLKQLLHHLDQHFASFVVSGTTHGFHIGDAGAPRLIFSRNLPSAFQHSQFVLSHVLIQHRCPEMWKIWRESSSTSTWRIDIKTVSGTSEIPCFFAGRRFEDISHLSTKISTFAKTRHSSEQMLLMTQELKKSSNRRTTNRC